MEAHGRRGGIALTHTGTIKITLLNIIRKGIILNLNKIAIMPVLLYAILTHSKIEKRMEAVEMKFLRPLGSYTLLDAMQ
jgi:hypothetical protein